MKAIERFFKQIYLNIRTRLVYGTLRPSRAKLVRCDHYVHIDPNDDCAWKKQVTDPIRGKYPHNIRFWRETCARLKPEFALDIGINYGECTFSADYDPKTRIIGFDANEGLLPYLNKSLAEHPQKDQISIRIGLVGDRVSEGEKFYIDRAWSGGSSAGGPIRGNDTGEYEEVIVPMIRIDDCLAEQDIESQTIVFKIDVEGFEARVLAGMESTIESTPTLIGLIEFGTELLDAAGEDIEVYWQWLQDRFDVYAFLRNGRLVDARGWSLEKLKTDFGHRRLHTDLMLLKAPEDSDARRYVGAWLEK